VVNEEEGPRDPDGPRVAAYQRIRDDIIAGLLRPDEKLKIRDLRQKYQAGSSPLREALSTLSADGLVTRTENRGFRVARADIAAYEDLVQARCWIESIALRESIARGTSRWEHEVVIAGYDLEKLLPSLRDDKFVPNAAFETQHKRYHMALIGACGNNVILQTCSQLFDHTTRYRHLADVKTYVSRGFTRGVEHKEISEAVLAREADRAVELICAHYRRTFEILKGTETPASLSEGSAS
jgi:GntR family carbon starvation induced transcriptional regulator